MAPIPRILTVVSVLWIATTALRAAGAQHGQSGALVLPPEVAPPSTSVTNPDYVGSDTCGQCHEREYDQWRRSLHLRMTKPIAEATVVADFSEHARLAAHGRAYEFGRKDGRPFIRVRAGDRPAETYPVDYALGFKRYQGFLSTLPDGRMYVLPAFWHVATKRWIDWKEITPIPDGAHDLKQIWNANCFNCHATNLVQGFDQETKTYRTTWTEMGIGCEACHGPGRAHIGIMEEWKRDPTQKPPFDKRIFSPAFAPPRQVFDTCAYCHGNKNNYFVGFRAGDRYEDYALPFLISLPIPENDRQGEFWPDGRPNRFNRPQALMLSGCFKAGAVTCTNCHAAHGSDNPFSLKVNVEDGRSGDRLCTQCHTPPAPRAAPPGVRPIQVGSRVPDSPGAESPWPDEALKAHTFHEADSAGSRCVNCHMSDVNWRILTRRRDHSFQPPVPEITARFGVPNACTTCHDDRTPEWAAGMMQQWWGDEARRRAQTDLADTMYRAGSGDISTIPALMRLAVDRSQGAIVRASAIDFIRRLVSGTAGAASVQSQTSYGQTPLDVVSSGETAVPITRDLVNVAMAAAADPEPVVRAAAVRTLAAFGRQDSTIAGALARLVDPARVVRMQAAEALLEFGIVNLPGRAGEALQRAQEEYILAMKMFPDAASNHASLAWMEAQRGRVEDAQVEIDRALALEPHYARPWVIKGVLAARAGRFDDAESAWKKAREIEPAYPNIDRLIAEARARR